MSFFVTIDLAGAPRGKGRGRAVSIPGKGARVYSDPATVKYETQLRYAATQAMGERAPTAGPVQLSMVARFPIPESWSKKKRLAALNGELFPTTKPDADNILKLADALNQICFIDDKQVINAQIVKQYSERPGLAVTVCGLLSKGAA